MKFRDIYHALTYFWLGMAFLLVGYALLGFGIYVYFQVGQRWFIYVLVIWSCYMAYSTFFIFKETLYKYGKYIKKGAWKEVEAEVTHKTPTAREEFSKALAAVSTLQGEKDYLIIGFIGRQGSFRNRFPDGTKIKIYVDDEHFPFIAIMKKQPKPKRH